MKQMRHRNAIRATTFFEQIGELISITMCVKNRGAKPVATVTRRPSTDHRIDLKLNTQKPSLSRMSIDNILSHSDYVAISSFRITQLANECQKAFRGGFAWINYLAHLICREAQLNVLVSHTRLTELAVV